MRKVLKNTLAITASAAVMAGAVVAPSISSAWGDNGNYPDGRRSYTIDQINHGVLGNKIVFNSIKDSVIGDEKNFVGARENTGINAGANNVWNGNDITVEDGKEYLVRLYVHNNSPLGEDAVSRNTRVAFNVPTESSTSLQVNGFIFSDNASPSEYWDYVNFNSDHIFHLEYVYGSAIIENNGIGSRKGGYPLDDEIVTAAKSKNGVQIGYNKLDGNVPGCYQYASYITIKVKAVFDSKTVGSNSDFRIEQTMRKVGTKDWSANVNAQVGDVLEIQGTYTNISDESQRGVMIRSVLPRNFEYIPGSTVLYNTNHMQGLAIAQDDIVTNGINIGNYGAKGNAFVRFKVKVVDNSLQCGGNVLVNWLQAGLGNKTIQDYATASLTKTCGTTNVEPTPEYSVRVDYIYADTGKKAAESYVGSYAQGDSFVVESPKIAGYTADREEIRATMQDYALVYTVKYTKVIGRYTLNIAYQYEDGTEAAASYKRTYNEGSSYRVMSPVIEGYTADAEVVAGEIYDSNVNLVVTYKKNQAPNDEEDPGITDEPIVTDKPTKPTAPNEMPNTGVEMVAGSVIALGSLTTSAGYYVASRRALKK